jgi:hypothetical protein
VLRQDPDVVTPAAHWRQGSLGYTYVLIPSVYVIPQATRCGVLLHTVCVRVDFFLDILLCEPHRYSITLGSNLNSPGPLGIHSPRSLSGVGF